MTKIRRVLASGVWLAVAAGSLAAPAQWQVLALPAAIETQQQIGATPKGWLVSIDAVPNRVSGITLFDGRPDRRVSLVPDGRAQHNAKHTLVHTWRLAPSAADGYWLRVSYSSTTVVLAMPLPQGTTALRASYDTTVSVGGLPRITRLECR